MDFQGGCQKIYRFSKNIYIYILKISIFRSYSKYRYLLLFSEPCNKHNSVENCLCDGLVLVETSELVCILLLLRYNDFFIEVTDDHYDLRFTFQVQWFQKLLRSSKRRLNQTWANISNTSLQFTKLYYLLWYYTIFSIRSWMII